MFHVAWQNLLHRNGFDIREQVQLERSSFLDSIANTLGKILQIARITHLDEVSSLSLSKLCVLHFGDDAGKQNVTYGINWSLRCLNSGQCGGQINWQMGLHNYHI